MLFRVGEYAVYIHTGYTVALHLQKQYLQGICTVLANPNCFPVFLQVLFPVLLQAFSGKSAGQIDCESQFVTHQEDTRGWSLRAEKEKKGAA